MEQIRLQKHPFPRISTRGYYDLASGNTIKSNRYYLYPKRLFQRLYGKKEIVIMIHGLRNDRADAVNKFIIAQKRLRKLRYPYPVIGFSYDANIKGAHLKNSELHALLVGQRIAKKNGKNLSDFILDFKSHSMQTKIRLVGHSLGTQVIMSTLEHLDKNSNKNIIESVYFFGSSVTSDNIIEKRKLVQKIIKTKLMNYYSPSDEVLKYAHETKSVINPLGLFGMDKKNVSKYVQKKVRPENHRFVSYANVLAKFP